MIYGYINKQLHRHPTRLSRAQTSSALLSTRSDVLTYVCGYKKSGATLLSLRRYCVCEELKAHLLKCRLMGIFLKVAQNLFDVDDFRA